MIKTEMKFFTLLLISILFFFLTACDEAPPVKKKAKPSVVKKKIVKSLPKPVLKQKKTASQSVQAMPVKNDENLKDASGMPKTGQGNTVPEKESPESNEALKKLELSGVGKHADKIRHYDSIGKIDPFKPLLQEEQDEEPVKETKPKRILTPLEKFALSQIRLVAIIQMKNKKIAMVEDVSGKGYEVTVGTYIGKKEGRITQINNSSIVVKELIKDFKGRLKEQIQEIKLYQNSDEE